MSGLNRRRPTGEEGASLLLALIFVALVSGLVASLLPYTQAGVGEAVTARDVRSVQNAADGAVQGAIQQVRQSLLYGSGGTAPCPTYTAPTYPSPVGGGSVNVTVTCQRAPGSTSPAADVPPYAIVTTKGGITLKGSVLTIDGGVYSAGDIGVEPGAKAQYVVVGDVLTKPGTTCDKVTATGILECPTTTPPPSFDYPSALGASVGAATTALAGLAADPPGICDPNVSYVRFQPGYYSELPTPGPSCSTKRSIYWLAPCATTSCTNTDPGVYYFDFADSSYDNYANNAYWNLNKDNISLLGGTLRSDWTTQPLGKRCDPKQVGVQVILGGASQLSTGNGSNIELCASRTSSTSLQRVALYGLSAEAAYGYAAPGGPRATATGEVAPSNAADTAGDVAWNNRDGAREIGDNAGANVALGAFDGTSASKTYGVDLNGYQAEPDGSLIAHAYINVRHAENELSGHLDPRVKIKYGDNSTDTCVVPQVKGVQLATSTIDLMVNCDDNRLKLATTRWRLLKNMTVTYEAVGTKAGNNKPIGTAWVDGVQVRTVSVRPALEAQRCQRGEATCYGYSNSNSSSSANTFFIGTVYATDSALNVVVHNNPETIFQRGVVAARLVVNASSSSKQSDSPFQLPHTAALDRTILFTATADGRVRLRARVRYIDCVPAPACATAAGSNGETNQVFPGRQVVVEEWTTLQ